MTAVARVLIVDDDASARQTVHAQLLPAGHDLHVAPDGARALDMLASDPVDVVVCDVMMHGVDGLDVCRAMKAHAAWQYVPVILLTALDGGEDVVRGLQAGADDFVSKPVEGKVLRARVSAMLRVRAKYLGLHTATSASEERRARLVEKANLSPREREVLDLLLLGRTHPDISTSLGISERTSRFHQENLLAKLGAESRLDLLRLFV